MMSKTIYLDNAATSFPKPPGVMKEIQSCIKNYCVNTGRSSHEKSRLADEKIFVTRELLADLFGIDNPEQIAFTLNATSAINQGLKGTLKRGDHLIISSMEHNSVLRPAAALKSQGIELDIAPANKNGEVCLDSVLPFIKENTKMVAMLHASNVTGRVNDIRSIGKELQKRKIIFLVDSAQSAGIVPINVRRDCIDILCFPGHKGLLGPTGTGGIYVSPHLEIRPIIEGGTGSQSESISQPSVMPDLLESGTPNVLGISALAEGVKFVISHGSELLEHENMLADRLTEKLSNMEGASVLGRQGGVNTGIVGVRLKGVSPAAAAFYLDRDYNIAVRAGFHCAYLAAKTLGITKDGSLRFSFGCFNTKSDVEKAADAMSKILKA